jgi:hypothetical protein
VSAQPPPGPREQAPSKLAPGGLDPDLAAAAADPDARERRPAGMPDTRRYRWTIGIFGLVLLIAFSIYEFSRHGVVSPGVAPGERLHLFVAPLATTGPDQPANPRPRCDPAHPNPRALNVCGRTPLVLVFFAPRSKACKRQVDTLQLVAREFPPASAQFAALAVAAGRAETAALVGAHGWTIPVAFDSAGAIGALYGVSICPMIELARPGGVVAQRLIGEHWLRAPELAGQVRALLRS